MHELIRWNVTSQQSDFGNKDILIVSIPKCGRTWLRVFLNAYYNRLYGGDHAVERTDTYPDPRPCYLFTHDRFSHVNNERTYDFLRGRHLIPARMRGRMPVVLLARDLRDVMVSLYFQHTKRRRSFQGDLDGLLRDRHRGVDTVIGIMNRWAREFSPERRLIARYEDWKADAGAEFTRILTFMSGKPVDDDALAYALEYSRFDKMKAREATAGQSEIAALRPGDAADEESFKARRGVVGGYKSYLSEAQAEYIRERMGRLDPAYGYSR